MTKLSGRLLLILFSVLTFFSIAFTACFAFLFLQYSDRVENNRIETRAMTLADSLAKTTPDSGVTSIYNNDVMYILNTFNQNEVWLIDKNSLQMTGLRSYPGLTYDKLPENMRNDISTVLDGGSIHTDDFASLTAADYITVGVPIYDKYGQVKAALLLHSSLPALNYNWYSGLEIMLFCLAVIFAISTYLLRHLSRRYIMPLGVINDAADKMINGHYDEHISAEKLTGGDEITQLARKMNKLSQSIRNEKQHLYNEEVFAGSITEETSRQLDSVLQQINKAVNSTSGSELKNAAAQLNTLAENLKEIAQISSPDFSLNNELKNLLEILQTSLTICRHLAEKKQIQITSKLELKTKIILFSGDADELERMFTIVVKEALRLYPRSSLLNVHISEDSRHYFISFNYMSGPECLPQPSAELKPAFLNLLLVKKIAQLHGIDFTYNIQPNQYISFKFTIEK